jgi:hypothetical protein
VNKIQVKRKKKKIECKEICNFSDSFFHKVDFNRFLLLDLSLVFGTKIDFGLWNRNPFGLFSLQNTNKSLAGSRKTTSSLFFHFSQLLL